jgi:radical SAM protein with 4Fe4S-binding SPASM domain
MSEDKKDTICVVPWMHLNFEPNGKVVPCCLTSTYNYFAGDLTTQTIEEIWNSDNMKNLRKDMIEGREPKICHKCFDREKVTGESGRVYQNYEFKEFKETIPNITLEDGTCTTMELLYWDFRFSNLCNFKCRSCGPRYSSAWVPDSKKLGWKDDTEKVTSIDVVDNKNNFDFLKDQIHNVKKIYFAGGEPLLMPEHWEILELLVQNERFDVKINYNTNCSSLTYGKKHVLEYWSLWKYPMLEVWPSIDEIGERAELIRSGTVWSRVEANLKDIVKHENIITRPGITVGAMNAYRLPEIITHLIDIGVITPGLNRRNFFLNLIEHPIYYHVSVLPDDFRMFTKKKLHDFLDEYKQKYNSDIQHLFTHLLHELDKPFDIDAAKKFVDITEKLDKIRNEDTYKVIPEMETIRIAVAEHNRSL